MSAERKERLNSLGFIWEPFSEQWEEGFQHLVEFLELRGHCRVPQNHTNAEGFRLGKWVKFQRVNKNKVSEERKQRLDALGFIWDLLADQWEDGLQHLMQFVKENGHCRVHSQYKSPDGYRLGGWVVFQRVKHDGMSAERKARLDALGFVWEPLVEQWEEGYRNLITFIESEGHSRVPRGYRSSDGFRLADWVNNTRAKRNEMSAERRARLDALGFAWEPRIEFWEEGFRRLKAFVKEHGHCKVPQNHKSADGYRLGQWISRTRARQGGISAERKARLDALGFVWSASKS